MTYQHKIVDQSPVDHGHVRFFLKDEKGREIGAKWVIGEVKTAPRSEDDERWTGYYRFDWADLTHFTAWVQPTRGTLKYGASQQTHRFKTIEEAWEKRNALLNGSEARYAKKYGASA